MSTQFDVIVVGAGLGGLSAATWLASKGLEVLLLERHNVPGGYATSFVRGRYEFEAALHELSGIGAGQGTLYQYLDQLGVTDHVAFLPVHELYRSVFPELDITVPVGREPATEALCNAFPHEADGIRRFLDKVFVLARELSAIQRDRTLGNPLAMARKFPNAAKYLPLTWGEVLGRYVKDPRAQGVLSQYWGYFGLPPSKCAFLYFAMALAGYMQLGPSYVRGRSHALANGFVAAFEGHGGVVRFNCAVSRITTAGGRVDGVLTADGTHYTARAVISNADPVTTCRELMAEDEVPASFFDGLRHRRVAAASFNVYLGVARSAEQLGFFAHENFINGDTDIDRHYQLTKTLEPPAGMLATCYNTVDPTITPPGTSQVVLTALYDGNPWQALRPEQYLSVKNRIADAMLHITEQIVPGLRQWVEVVEVATPLTNLRYSGAMGGSIYGFENTTSGHTVLRIPNRGPVDGLWFSGAWTQPGGGFEPCMMSGAMAGSAVLHKLSKTAKEAS